VGNIDSLLLRIPDDRVIEAWEYGDTPHAEQAILC
jgi:hypothetical protein